MSKFFVFLFLLNLFISLSCSSEPPPSPQQQQQLNISTISDLINPHVPAEPVGVKRFYWLESLNGQDLIREELNGRGWQKARKDKAHFLWSSDFPVKMNLTKIE